MATEKSPEERKLDREIDIWKTQNAAATAVFNSHLTVVARFSEIAINSIILGNSAAAGAVLAFIGAAWSRSAYNPILISIGSIKLFIIGVVAGILAAMFAYCSQFTYMTHDIRLKDAAKKVWAERLAMVFHGLSAIFAVAGLVLFVWGALRGLDALVDAAPILGRG